MANNESTMFEKVSFEHFKEHIEQYLTDEGKAKLNIREVYDNIKLPKRSTQRSAGYDFFLPIPISAEPGCSIIIPSGIKFKCKNNEYLMMVPRSGQGIKYHVAFANTAGIIDADYYNCDDTEGDIFISITRPNLINVFKTENLKAGKKTYNFIKEVDQRAEVLNLNAGDAIAQGIIMTYGLVDNDSYSSGTVRVGGWGSTDKQRLTEAVHAVNNASTNVNNKVMPQTQQNNQQRPQQMNNSQNKQQNTTNVHTQQNKVSESQRPTVAPQSQQQSTPESQDINVETKAE